VASNVCNSYSVKLLDVGIWHFTGTVGGERRVKGKTTHGKILN
jgi:hypothetical protein